MKTSLIITGLLLAGSQLRAAIHTVVTDGLHFVPERVVARVGDTIEFDLSPGFTATEVSAATWTTNGNVPLKAQGAFDFENPAMFQVATQGQRFYVCKWHNFTGMKGFIEVIGPSNVAENEPELMVSIYPNPVTDILNFNVLNADNMEAIIDLYDQHGSKVMDLGAKQVLSNGAKRFDVSKLPGGIYFLNITMNNRVKSYRFLKQ